MTAEGMHPSDTLQTNKINAISGEGSLTARLQELASEMGQKGATLTEQRVLELGHRLRDGDTRVRIALCGLFSAGKSSLINALTQHSKLATGAVPTTAEVEDVLWEHGGASAILMDTPGIDSTDEAHQAATDAAMHLADIVLLVLDYAHVESEENLEFARQLTARRKQLLIVINQIDKHSDFELSFEDFSRRVTQSLMEEGILYDGIFYTSSRPSPYSQLDALREKLLLLASGGSDTVEKSVRETALGLVDEALDTLYAEKEWDSETALLECQGRTPLHMEEAREWLEELERASRLREEKQKQHLLDLESLEKQAEEGFLRSIDLGQIAPYGTTELGRKYVESLRPDFKVGWFGAEKKTAEEREKRLLAFLTDLQQTTRQNLVWPLQRELRSFLHTFDYATDESANDIDELSVDIRKELLVDAVHHGALGNGQYPYQYVKEVVGRVKAEVRRALQRTLDKWWNQAAVEAARAEENLTDEEVKQVEEQKALERWIEVRRERQALQDQWFSFIQG